MEKPHFDDGHYIYFVTSKTFKNYPYFKEEKNCYILLNVINELKKELDFKLFGYVIMPDHLHCLIEPALDKKFNISYIMMRIKGWSARLIKLAEAEPSAKREDNNNLACLGEASASPSVQVWQKSFHQIQIYSEKFFNQKLNYIHENPLKSQLVKDPADSPWSSYRNIYLDNNFFFEIDRPAL